MEIRCSSLQGRVRWCQLPPGSGSDVYSGKKPGGDCGRHSGRSAGRPW